MRVEVGSLVAEIFGVGEGAGVLRDEFLSWRISDGRRGDFVVSVEDGYSSPLHWRESTESADGVFVVDADARSRRLTLRSLFWEGVFDLQGLSVQARVRRLDSQSMEALLRSTTQAFALELSLGAVIHASSVELGGACALFMGPSGSGKSTAARLLEEAGHARVLTDDVTFVSLSMGRPPEVVTLPFRQRFEHLSRKARARVVAVYDLRQADAHAVVDLAGPGRVGAVAKSVAVGARTPMLAARALDAAEALAALVPVRRLAFSRDAGFWDIVGPALRGGDAGAPTG